MALEDSMIKPPAQCTSMQDVRDEIDRIDGRLVELMAERFSYVDRAWQIKKGGKEGALVPWRVQQVIDKVKAQAEQQGLPPELMEAMWRQMVEWSIQYESEKLEESGTGQE